MGVTYLDICTEVKRCVNVDDLSSRKPGDLVGIAGSGYCFRQLGALSVTDLKADYVGLKIPRLTEKGIIARTHYEIAFIALQLNVTPELNSYFPRFMNLIQVEDSDSKALLTEDVSEGGHKELWGQPASSYVREMLYRPFSEYGAMDEVLDHHELNRTTAFDVGGEEKLLDLVPPPVQMRYRRRPDLAKAYSEAVHDALPNITITIPRDSNLADFLLNPGPENY